MTIQSSHGDPVKSRQSMLLTYVCVIYKYIYICVYRYSYKHIYLHSYINLRVFSECKGRLAHTLVPPVCACFIKISLPVMSRSMYKSLHFSVPWSVLSVCLLTGRRISVFLQPGQWSAVLPLHEQRLLLHVCIGRFHQTGYILWLQ